MLGWRTLFPEGGGGTLLAEEFGGHVEGTLRRGWSPPCSCHPPSAGSDRPPDCGQKVEQPLTSANGFQSPWLDPFLICLWRAEAEAGGKLWEKTIPSYTSISSLSPPFTSLVTYEGLIYLGAHRAKKFSKSEAGILWVWQQNQSWQTGRQICWANWRASHTCPPFSLTRFIHLSPLPWAGFHATFLSGDGRAEEEPREAGRYEA